MAKPKFNSFREASDKAFDTLKVFTKNYATVERTSTFSAKIIHNDPKDDISGTTMDFLGLNGFKVNGFSISEDGLPVVEVSLYKRIEQEIEFVYVSCTKCYNDQKLRADVAEMFGISLKTKVSNNIDGCPQCKSGLPFLKRR